MEGLTGLEERSTPVIEAHFSVLAKDAASLAKKNPVLGSLAKAFRRSTFAAEPKAIDIRLDFSPRAVESRSRKAV